MGKALKYSGNNLKNSFESVNFLVKNKTHLQVFLKDFTKLKLSVIMFWKFRNTVFFFIQWLLQATDKKIATTISSLNSDKASRPNIIPFRILFLLNNEVLKQLVDLFNFSFMNGVFPSVLKTAKVVLFLKGYSKSDYDNYRPISLLSNIEKKMKSLCI